MKDSQKAVYRSWEYARSGDYHRNLDPNWSYTPTYLRKMAYVRRFVDSLPRNARILDAACGEGVLVEEFGRNGWDIEGLDLNYESASVRRGDVRELPYPSNSFDLVLLLDALEHLAYEDQPRCLAEIHRVIRPMGFLLISVPNLAHLNSRIRFLLRGELDRTDIETNHVGERPIAEYVRLLKAAGFVITDSRGATLTLPWVYRGMICGRPARYRWLHDAMEPLARSVPSLTMLAMFVCQKTAAPRDSPGVGRSTRQKLTRKSGHPGLFSIPTHLTERERVLLFELAGSLPTNASIVEIGSYLGASTCFLAAGVRPHKGTVYAIDTWTNTGMSDGVYDTYRDFLHSIVPLRDSIVPLRGLSTEISINFDQPIDLLFVDGDHSYEAVRSDLEVWLPKLKSGALVVLHDFSWAEGIRRAVRELVMPFQSEGGRRCDSIYWTRIAQQKRSPGRPEFAASLIIPTYNRPALLRDALHSLQTQDFKLEDYEIIVVDNGPSSATENVVREANSAGLHPVRYLREPVTGLHNARHTGARHAQAEILVYVDDDVIAHPGWLRAIVTPFADPYVVCVSGKVVAKWEDKELPNWWPQSKLAYLSLLDLGDETIEIKWPCGVHGCNMAIRRSVLYGVGGFNPDAMGDRRFIWLRGDGETGLHKKLSDAGYKVLYEPRAWLYHRIPPSRLSIKSLCWRAFIQGISDSYSRIRENSSIVAMLRHGIRCLLRSSLLHMRSVRCRRDGRAIVKADAWYWYGRGRHQLHAATRPGLRKEILRDSYL